MNRLPSQMNHTPRLRCGLSLLELLLALSVTALVTVAIAGMLGAVSSGVGARRDARAVMVLANAAATRMSAYIAPSLCVLDVDGPDVVIWFNDSRESNTVHASEIRWLIFDQSTGTLAAHYISLPDGWTQAARDLADNEYPIDSNWSSVLATYAASGWTASRILVDNLDSVQIATDAAADTDACFLGFTLGFKADDQVVPISLSAKITQHTKPAR